MAKNRGCQHNFWLAIAPYLAFSPCLTFCLSCQCVSSTILIGIGLGEFVGLVLALVIIWFSKEQA
ncbi:MAG: hypothetical protein SAK29_05785 [Scytonema sp. PMC 1069.18]|nr:hypothetical protein [Scytonema sp. PMC 1069.18]MEC4885943.1 hypothetical protein [Scytonema sp. PMC 1070.18]